MNGLADVGSKTIDNFVSAKKSVANFAGNSIKSVGEVAANTIDNIGDIVDETIDFTGYVKKKGIVGVIDSYEKFGKIKIDDNFKLPEEAFTTGVSEDDYNKVVAFKLKENRELAKQIKPIEEDLLSEKNIIDAIQKEYNDIDYNYGIELDRWDANVHEQFIALRNDLADEEVLKSHGLSLADKNLTEEELLAKSHKNEDYISLKTWRKEAVEELFNKYEMTKGFKEEDYEKFTVIKNDNLKNLEVLKAVRKNNENEYNQMEYNCLTLLEDYKKVEDQLSRKIDNPVGDEKYVNQLGGQYLSIYNYLKLTNPSKAQSYLKAIEDPINQKKGEENALARIAKLSKDSEGNIKDSLLNEINVAGYGFGDGLVDFGEGIYKIIDDDMTVQDYEVMVYLSYLTSMQNNVYSTAQSIGNMTIPIAASTLVGLFAPEAQPFVSSTLIGASAYGNTKAQMLYEGYDRKTAMLYAGCTATSDAVLEVLLGGIENIGLSTLTDSAEKLALRDFALKQLREMVQEGGEEVVQDFVKSSVFDQKILHKTFDISEFSDQAMRTFLQSAVVAGVLNGGQTMVHVAVEGSIGTLYADDIMAILERSQNGENISDVVNEVLEHNTNSDSSSEIESIGTTDENVDNNESLVDTINSNEKLKPVKENIEDSYINNCKENKENFVFYHGGANQDFNVDQIDILRPSTKQGSKYVGFYMHNELDREKALNYTNQSTVENPGLHRIELSSDANIVELDGFSAITRITEEQMNEYKNAGVDLIIGKNPLGRYEYLLVNKDKIINMTSENISNNTMSYLKEISGSDSLSELQKNSIDSSLESLSWKIGSDSDTVKEALEVKMNNIINDSEFGVRVDEKALSSILDTGLKNQFETNSSGGALNKTKRLSAEKNLFNVPVDSLDSDRPVYGMVFPKYNDYSQFYKRGPGSFYAILQQRDSNGKLELDSSGYGIIANNPETGERYSSAVILLKKDNIINNTTFTMGDSLDVGISKLNGQATIQGSLATNPTFKGADNRIFDSINSLDDIKNADLQTFFPANDFRSNRYMELQIHGQESHYVSNIKEVIFTSGTVSDSIIKKLESKGIPYKIMPRFE